MRTLPTNFTDTEILTLTWCWRITRLDGLEIGATNFDQPLEIDGLTYTPTSGMNPSAISLSEGTESPDNAEVQLFIDSGLINIEDIISGRWNWARVDTLLVDYLNPLRRIFVGRGVLGQVTLTDKTWGFQSSGLESLLDHRFGESTTKECRATFGDSRCKKDLTGLTHGVTVSEVIDRYSFRIAESAQFKPGYFDGGTLEFISGDNQAVRADVINYSNGVFVLLKALPRSVMVGDMATAVAGCPKTLLACQIFNNLINYRGEPHIPLDKTD